MSSEGFREYWAAFSEAESAIGSAEALAGMLEESEGRSEGLLVGLAVIGVAQAIQAQTLGLRLVAQEGRRG